VNRTDQLMVGYYLPPLTFTADEAALLVLGGEQVGGTFDGERSRRHGAIAIEGSEKEARDDREAVIPRTEVRGSL
jgi:predicted DNA-binding transcriptional regulator YafY